ncbi:MAG: molybdopterin-guanine dinucleotide biosynthesis protein B [bacterium]
MVPIISIVGKRKSGKTTLIERLIPELKNRGLRVGTIKHDVYGFEMDREGKDTWRHSQPGAETVVIASSSKLGLFSRIGHELTLDELANKYFAHVDIILTEGYKSGYKPKIEVLPNIVSEPLCGENDNLIAVVSDGELELGVPLFHREETSQLADFIIETFDLKASREK